VIPIRLLDGMVRARCSLELGADGLRTDDCTASDCDGRVLKPRYVSKYVYSDEELARLFRELSDRWYRDTLVLSSIQAKTLIRPYLRSPIVASGFKRAFI